MAKKNGKPSKVAAKVAELTGAVKEAERQNNALMAALASESASIDATYEASSAELVPKPKGKVAKLVQNAMTKTTRTHQVTVDFGGGVIAQASTELINLGVRALANWSPESWFGKNSDVLQGAPHFILGLGVYIAEMASRKELQLPSTTREVVSEASKLFGQLGFSNLVRALRVRYGDSKQAELDAAALQQENEKLRQMNQQLLQKAGGPK